ncbi:MAG: hypothetical protein JNG88_11320 [Phycisphaerales bacterium]|nr:hypothetical protein [Phycisphaerales bacterium]
MHRLPDTRQKSRVLCTAAPSPTATTRRGLILAAIAAVSLASAAFGQTDRSSTYDGTNNATSVYAARSQYDSAVTMTIEAWVYRYDSTRCETIVGHGWQQSYWLGFCPRLRFYRSGGVSADATVDVPHGQWTHVAVTYDGSTVRFYIDGQPAGVSTLSNAGANRTRELRIGSDVNGGYYFYGQIDEVRLWNRVRTPSQIANNIYNEVRTGTGLVGAWAMGGGTETLHGWTATTGSGVTTRVYGILPRNLRVPRAAFTPVIDGNVHTTSEYAGADVMMVRVRNPNAPFAYDSAAYFVHDDNYLYVGYGFIRWPYNDQDPTQSYIGLMVDPTYSRTSDLDATHFMAAIPAGGAAAPTWYVGGAPGNNFELCSGAECPPAGTWEVERGYCGDDVLPPCVEFKIPLSELGSWNELDGIAITQFNLSPSGDRIIGPSNATWNSPATWATVEYTDGSAQLPHARLSGRLFNGVSPDRSQPQANRPIYAGGSSGSPMYVQYTDNQGNFSFDIPVPLGEMVRLEIAQCSGCRGSDPIVSTTGIQPEAVADHVVFFPACPAGSTCDYASVDFFLQQPLNATTITGFTPPIGWRPIVVRVANPPITVPSARVRISGTNMHDQMTLFLAKENTSQPVENWEKYETPIVNHDSAWAWVEGNVPTIPNTNGVWRWVIRDNWVRPGYSRWVLSAQFPFGPSPYPITYGFGFDNADDDASFSEFLSSYGNNSYLCVGAFGVCACRVINPLYLLYWPIYRQWINSSGGSCMGMTGTSLMFARGALSAQSFDADARFPRGILQNGSPADYDWDACSAPDPENLWAYIRNNHGSQTSNQAITYALEEMFDDNESSSYESSPTARLAEVRAAPINYAISVAPGIGEGHVVLPWKVTQVDATHWRIHVYDNNSVYNVTAPADDFIEIDTAADTFTYRHPDGRIWSGRAIFTYPYQLFVGERDAPGLVDALSWMLMAVFGDADVQQRGAGGAEWGWRPDGTFVDNMPGLLALNPLGPSGAPTRQVPVVIPNHLAMPQTRINARGSHYLFHAAGDKTVLQLEAFNAVANAVDRVNVGRRTTSDGNTVRAMRFTPERAGMQIAPRIGMQLGEQAAAVFKVAGLQLPANQAAEFTALHERRGMSLRNFTNTALSYRLATETVDGDAEVTGTAVFGPFDIPAGAIHSAVINDWPACNEIRSELDLDADGDADEVTIVTGTRCGESPNDEPSDANNNGIPDMCEARTGDMNCDGRINNFDIDGFVIAISDPAAYAATYPDCLATNADVNGDGRINNFDVTGFVACLEAGTCP